MSGKHDRAAELRAIADGRLLLNVRNGVTVSRSMLAMIADELEAQAPAISTITPAEAGGLWVPANPEHAKLGWTYDFEQVERIAMAAHKSTGYDATMEVVEFVMAEAGRQALATSGGRA